MQVIDRTPSALSQFPDLGGQSRRREDAVVSDLISGYSLRGGVASTEEVLQLMRPFWRQPISLLAKWIIDHRVVSFSWRRQLLLPMFQFERPRMTPHQGVFDSLVQISDLMDDEAQAVWFIQPNVSLEHESPADLVMTSPEAVVCAARQEQLALMAGKLIGRNDRAPLAGLMAVIDDLKVATIENSQRERAAGE
jgi:hypothetical protein